MWFKAEGFHNLIADWWANLEFQGTKSYVLMEKMKALKVMLRSWNKETFGIVEERKKQALQKANHWSNIECLRPLSQEETVEKVGAVEEYKKWAVLEETYWRQKSREIWLKEGDKNTRFHRMANSHRRRNTISELYINGKLVKEEEALRQGIANTFESLFMEIGGQILRG